MNLVQRLILYLFPLYLTAMEQIIRTVFGSEAFSVSATSSSVSVGGMALLLPLLVPNPRDEEFANKFGLHMVTKRFAMYRKMDHALSVAAWIILLTMTFVWIFSLSRVASETKVTILSYQVPLTVVIALGIYMVGIVLTEVKEFCA